MQNLDLIIQYMRINNTSSLQLNDNLNGDTECFLCNM
jgi:hypothetical protein